MWKYIESATFQAAVSSFGKRTRRREDWFEANLSILEPAFENQRKAPLNYKAKPPHSLLTALRAACSEAQGLSRECANDYWNTLAEEVQHASGTGNIKLMFKGFKKAFGPCPAKCPH
jgi:hypothetical protein